MDEQHLLQEQMAYYRARAHEYDEWFYRVGARYDMGEAGNANWFAQADIVRQKLLNRPQVAQALELAGGTGIWTHELTKIAAHVTSIDASAEVQAISRAKNPDANVTYLQADLFVWQPETTYDFVFFGFWLSHVPPARLDDFLATVKRALNPGGTLFLVDSYRNQGAEAHDNPRLPDAGHIHTRNLKSGDSFNIVKVFYQPDSLQQTLTAHGFQATVTHTPDYFLYGEATVS